MFNKKTRLYKKSIKVIATKLTKKQLKLIGGFLEMAYLDGKMAKAMELRKAQK